MPDNKWLRNSFVWVIIMVAMLVLFFTFVGQKPSNNQIPISQVVADVKAGKVDKIIAHEETNDITVCYDSQCTTSKTSVKDGTDSLSKYLADNNVPSEKQPTIEVQKAAQWGN